MRFVHVCLQSLLFYKVENIFRKTIVIQFLNILLELANKNIKRQFLVTFYCQIEQLKLLCGFKGFVKYNHVKKQIQEKISNKAARILFLKTKMQRYCYGYLLYLNLKNL